LGFYQINNQRLTPLAINFRPVGPADIFACMATLNIEESSAFIETFTLSPTGDGPLNGLRFAVKDLIDVAGYRTGCGNPTWLETHPPAAVHAVCVEQLLAVGAECVGKTITDELAFSLLGENHFYGTPLNAAAPDRVPGGSSSGSASAVSCGLVDFALGTDTGGSVRVPASNCGIWGWRPTHGVVSVAGVMPLAPTYDTVGILARDADVLRRASRVLLADETPTDATPAAINVVEEAFSLADAEVREALEPVVERVAASLSCRIHRVSLREVCGEERAADASTWRDLYRFIMGSEAVNSLGAWLDAGRPELGPMAATGFKFARSIDRTRLGQWIEMREKYAQKLSAAVGARDLLCIPTSPTIAPLKGSSSGDRNSDYYQRTLATTAISGVGRLPQVTMPLANVNGVPIGLSLIDARGEDAFLLDVASAIANDLHGR
jgi:amidase